MQALDVCVSVRVCADLWAWEVSTAQISVDLRIGGRDVVSLSAKTGIMMGSSSGVGEMTDEYIPLLSLTESDLWKHRVRKNTASGVDESKYKSPALPFSVRVWASHVWDPQLTSRQVFSGLSPPLSPSLPHSTASPDLSSKALPGTGSGPPGLGMQPGNLMEDGGSGFRAQPTTTSEQ
ncbi:hypothetical protein MJT46_009949 [Ovis ammon polii x Ovis aries]|nr:hypothetical protein MJT46_009949 [Ovis ammon polii x Ovis aries]